MIAIKEIKINMGCPGAEEPNSVVKFSIIISLGPAGGSFLRRAGENF
jgi:hypothetical protein